MPQGFDILDFGAIPSDYAEVTVAGLASIGADSPAEAFFMRDSTADNNAVQHEMAAAFIRLSCGDIVPATSMKVKAECFGAKARGQFKVRVVHN